MSAEKSLMNSTGYNSKEGSPQAATKTSMKRRKTRHMTLLNVLTLKKLSSTGSRQSYHDIIKSRDDANFAAVFKRQSVLRNHQIEQMNLNKTFVNGLQSTYQTAATKYSIDTKRTGDMTQFMKGGLFPAKKSISQE